MSLGYLMRPKWTLVALLSGCCVALLPQLAPAQMPPDMLRNYVGKSASSISGCSDPTNNRSFNVDGSLEITSQTGANFTGSGEFLSVFVNQLIADQYTLTGTSTDDGILTGTAVVQTLVNGQPQGGPRTTNFNGCTGGPTCASVFRTNDPARLTIITDGGPTGVGGCIFSGATISVFACGNGELDLQFGEECDDGDRLPGLSCCGNNCLVPRGNESTFINSLILENTCPPIGDVSEATDNAGASLDLRCDTGSEFRMHHSFPPRGFDKDISRAPYAGSLSFETIDVSIVLGGPSPLFCAQEIFWRAREPKTLADPSGCTPGCSGDYCQGTCGVADWVTFTQDVNRGVLRCEHFTSVDGPGRPNDQRVRVETDCDVATFPTPDLARVTMTDPMGPDVTNGCDNDYDGDCDRADFDLIEASIGLCSDMGSFNEPADIDRDGCVTQTDLDTFFPLPEPAAALSHIAALAGLWLVSSFQRRQKRG